MSHISSDRGGTCGRSRSLASSLPFGHTSSAHDQHVARRLDDDLGADRAEQQAFDQAAVAGADRDEVGAVACGVEDGGGWLADLLDRRGVDSAVPQVLRRFLEQAAMGLLLARIGKAGIRRIGVDRVGDADDRQPTRHHGRDLADSLDCVLRLGGAVLAEEDTTPRHCCLPRRRMHVGCHRRRYEVAAARGRAGASPASAAPCWISRTRTASTMSLTPRISAKAATQATSRMALRPK